MDYKKTRKGFIEGSKLHKNSESPLKQTDSTYEAKAAAGIGLRSAIGGPLFGVLEGMKSFRKKRRDARIEDAYSDDAVDAFEEL